MFAIIAMACISVNAQTRFFKCEGAMYLNSALGTVESFQNARIYGVTFDAEETGIRASVEDGGIKYTSAFFPYSQIKNFVVKKHGISRIVIIQGDNSVNSFILSGDDKDLVEPFLKEKINKP